MSTSKSKLYYRYFIWGVILLVAYYISRTLFSIVIALSLTIFIMGISFYSSFRYYQKVNKADAHTRGMIAVRQQQIFSTYGMLSVLTWVYYRIAMFITGEVGISLILAVFLIFITYQLMYFYAGRGHRLILDRKKQRHNQFVDAIAPKLSQCLSCFESLVPGDRFCSGCGFDNGKHIATTA